jgi:ubiquinone biosynthesis monooxygenase Coq7
MAHSKKPPLQSHFSPLDLGLTALDQGMRTLWARSQAVRRCPSASPPEFSQSESGRSKMGSAALSLEERSRSANLMRVNHVGEVCAQALYSAQALTCHTAETQSFFERSRTEETDHLAWTQQRLNELGGRPSLLNPLWYLGAFALGYIAGRFGEPLSLGFTMETERQVQQHLCSHLIKLPDTDFDSRKIIEQMIQDEEAHGKTAQELGATEIPHALKCLMTLAGKIMTSTASRF